MLSLNKVTLIGELVEAPVIRDLENGSKAVGLSVMTTGRWVDADRVEKFCKEWHRVVIIHASLVAFAEAELQQGDDIYIEGELHTEVWLSETFETRTLTKVVLWQDGHLLRRLDESAPATSTAEHHPIFLTSRNALLFAEG